MRLMLETLENRTMMDAALANAFLTYLAPQMLQSMQVVEAVNAEETKEILGMAYSAAAVLGPQFAAANLPAVVNAAEAFLAAQPSLQVAMTGEIQADYNLLLSAPYKPGELQAIIDTAMMESTLDSQLQLNM